MPRLTDLRVGMVVTELLEGRFVPWDKSLGWGSYLDYYCLSLARRGHECIKYVPSIGVDKPVTYTHKFGHLVKRIPVYDRILAPRSLLRPKRYEGGYTTELRLLQGTPFTLGLFRQASADEIDVLHYSSYYSLFFLPAFLTASRFATVCQYTGGSLPSGALPASVWKVLLSPSMKACDGVLVGDYESEIRALTTFLGVKRAKQKHFDAPIIDPDVFHQLDKSKSQAQVGMDPTKTNILSVTFIPLRHSIGFAKNPYLLVDVFAEAGSQGLSDCILHIIGWGPGEEDLAQYVRERRLSDRVKIYGRVDHDRLATFYAAVELVFVPYPLEKLNEGSVTIEAFACGRPVAAFKRNPRDEIDQVGGFLVDQNPGVAGRTLLEYLQRPEVLEQKGREGRELSDRFTIGYAGRRLEEIYTEVIAQR